MTKSYMRARYEWLDALSAKSSVIKDLGVKNDVSDALYKAAGTKSSVNADAFNLSNSDEHNQAVIDTIEQLSAKGAQPAALKKFYNRLPIWLVAGSRTRQLLMGSPRPPFCMP